MANIIIILVAAFATGIGIAGERIIDLSLLYVCLVLLFLGFIGALFKKPKFALMFLTLVFMVAGMMHLIHVSYLPVSDISNFSGQKLTVIGTITDIPAVSVFNDSKNKIRYKLNVNTVINEHGHRIPATGGVLVNVYQDKSQSVLDFGTEMAVAGTITLPHSYGNPGMIDTAAALKRQGITARLSVTDGNIRYNEKNKWHWQNTLAGWKENIIQRMKKTMPQDNAAILAGTLFGGYTGITQEVVASFSTTGIVHILSVSGTHIALVAGVVFWLGSLLRVRQSTVSFGAALAIILYSLISGCTPPVVRSAVMGIIGLAAIGLKREKDAPVALMIAAFMMLVYQPENLFDISFQLSFGATAGLIFLYPKIISYLNNLPVWFSAPFAVTLSAQLSVLPIISWYFKSISLSSFVANLVVVPIIEFAVVLGLIASTLGAIIEPANLLWSICNSLIELVVQMTKQLAAVPGASIYIPPIGFWGGAVYYALLIWSFGYVPRTVPLPAEICNKWPKAVSLVSLITAIVLALWINYPRTLSVHFIDVGQGDAILVITPHRHAILIDSGGSAGQTNDFDIGERVVLPYLKHYGILDIDYMILTHGHQDHAGGAAAIVSGITVRNIMVAREEFTPAVNMAINKAADSVFIPTYKNQQISIDGTVINIIHDGNIGKKSANESSTVIRVSFGKHSFLVTGDLEAKNEMAILAERIPITSTVLKVGHHGSKTSTTEAFLAAVQPQYAVISVGYNNRFGHPHSEVINRLSQHGVEVFRTDESGAVVFESDGEHIDVKTFVKK